MGIDWHDPRGSKWLPSLADLIGAADRAAIAAIDDRDQTLTYGELLARAGAIAAEIGSTRALVLLEGGSSVDWLVAYVGCLLGRHPVMLVPAGDGATAARLASSYQPEFCMTAGSGFRPHRLLDPGGVVPHADLAVILSTSGSTGSTKCVRLSQGNVAANARSIGEYLAIGPDERGVASLPTHYSYGLSIVNSHLAAGATLLLTARSVIEPEFWDFCTRHQATSFAGVPYSYELLQRIDLASKAPPSLRYFTQAGGRLPVELVRHFAGLAREHGWRFFVMYGQTEATARMAYLPPDRLERHPDCIGIAIPGGRFELVDADGRPLTSALAEGELVYHGPNVMMGYALGPSDLALPAGPARLPTGDLARRTADGLFQITGRISRFVKIFGNRVGLDEVEQILEREGHPAIATGVDELLLVATRAPQSEAAIRTLLTERLHLPADKITVRVVDDYPLLASGKIDYASLKAELVAEIEREQWWSVATVEPEDRGEAVRQIFANVFGNADDESASFNARGGDSLTYISTVLALEPLIPELPDDWSDRPLSELIELADAGARGDEAGQTISAVPKNLDTVRAIACVLVVALHVLGDRLNGGLDVADDSGWHKAMEILGVIRLPLFTAMAGFLFAMLPASRMGFVPFMRRKIDTLLWPMLFGIVFFWSVRRLTGHDDDLLGLYLHGSLHYWYINAILGWFLTAAILDTVFTMDTPKWAVAMLAAILLWCVVPHPQMLDDLYRPDYLVFFFFGILLYRVPALWQGTWQALLGVALLLSYTLGEQILHEVPVHIVEQLWRMFASAGAIVFCMSKFPRIRLIEGIAFYSFTIYLWHVAANSVVRGVLVRLGFHGIPELFFIGVFFSVLLPIVLHRIVAHFPTALRIPLIGR